MYCQLYKSRETESGIEALAHTIEQQLGQISLQSMDYVVDALKNGGYTVTILKKNRPDSTAGERDSYIIGIHSGKDTIAVKIHPDNFRVCRKIYKNSPLLEQLVHDGDTSNIYSTGTSNTMRFVIYRWGESPTLQDAMEDKHIPIEKIRTGVQNRIESLTKKGIFVRGSTPGDWIIDSEGDVRLLDLNKAHSTRNNNRDMTKISIRNNGIWFHELLTGSRP